VDEAHDLGRGVRTILRVAMCPVVCQLTPVTHASHWSWTAHDAGQDVT